MRDTVNNRAGFDRVLMAVAATFLAVSATSAITPVMAQDAAHNNAAELAIDAAVPRPEPANVPPPTVNDFKPDVTASVPDAKVSAPDQTANKPADVATTPVPAATPATANIDAAKPDMAKPDATKPETAKVEPGKVDTKAEPDKSDSAAVAPTAPAAATATPAAPAQEPTKAASNVPAADQPVADKLRDLLGAKSSHYFERKAERAAVEKFYTAHDFAPLWTQGGTLTETAKGVIARLKDAAADGLNPEDYPVPDFAAATDPDARAEADLKLTSSMMDYARQAQSGRMHWSQVSGDISYPEHPVDPSEVLANVTTAKDASAALDGYNPPQKLYRDLKKKLAELRGQGDGPVIQIAEGPTLKFTPSRNKKQPTEVVEDPRVPQLRAKLGITENASDDHYDAKVAEAVRTFQEGAELRPTGILDDKTVNAINSPKRGRQIDTVVVNMERWRWLPRDLGAPSIGDAYVILNIPDYTLKVMQHGATVWTTKVVTGKPGVHATPLLTETMKYITVNPTWNVPPSIVYGEYLPALQQDPTVLERMGLRLERNSDGSVHISQPPGDGNALGRIRFNFPNKFLVYQHDTPDKYLFAKEERAFSHGCMRVQNPDQYASILLNITEPNEHYTPEKIRSMYGSSEVDLKFPTPIPVNITYQTAFVDEAGKLEFRKDIYGRDGLMLSLLRNSKNKDMEAVVAHAQPSYSHPVGNLPTGPSLASDNSSSGPSFFERLFGGSTPAPAPPRPQRRIFTR
ncbi:L,D-transpeptidase family protein [Bradyrhizobium sp. dw_78]|uniref:L,D-transpeptidase family protein n=1 Tax=Bradyrhizobium sp. dw_78 TaxID=2719793 RepID=UPI001BD30B15|nr:L,D-transpeptidase family protein [Bradyrhizobium sp. dw_78]